LVMFIEINGMLSNPSVVSKIILNVFLFITEIYKKKQIIRLMLLHHLQSLRFRW
jgi:hypothetical protein